jgi:hypothetical protein
MLAEDMGRLFDDPIRWACYAFDWDSDKNIQLVKTPKEYKHRWRSEYGLDLWALTLLDEWGKAIKKNGFSGKKAVSAYQAAVTSGHGIGKSMITSLIILFIMSTRPHCRGMVTANTSDQLKTKTWAELGKWKKRCITGHWFEYNNSKGNMNLYHRDFPESWRCDGQTCREENSESFAGLHSATSSPFYIFDESSAIPDTIWEVAEGGMTDGEPFWFAFGNPTRTNGRFRECFRKFRHRWITQSVDSREVQITNKDKIAEWVSDWGEDSDFVKVRVRGVFPTMSLRQFFPEGLVMPALGRQLERYKYDFAPKVLTVDPAWEGDDELVISLRQGLTFQILRVIPKNDNDVLIANIVANYEDELQVDCVNIDGGFGVGIISVGRTMGREWNIIWFASASPDVGCLNMRAYMAVQAKKWLQEGGCLPDDDELRSDIENVELVPRLDGKIQLEGKKDMKKRGLRSPGRLDTFFLSFATPVVKKREYLPGQKNDDFCENAEY